VPHDYRLAIVEPQRIEPRRPLGAQGDKVALARHRAKLGSQSHIGGVGVASPEVGISCGQPADAPALQRPIAAVEAEAADRSPFLGLLRGVDVGAAVAVDAEIRKLHLSQKVATPKGFEPDADLIDRLVAGVR